jgi:hypothetical protein
MAYTQIMVNPAFTPVRLVASSNLSGTYYNGPANSGVKATFTFATGALTIDSVAVKFGDRVLLAAQTAGIQNGIYVCTTEGSTGVAAVLERAADLQCIEHVQRGYYVVCGAGSTQAGAIYVITEPLPGAIGLNQLNWTKA